jgi:hypothetical protein
MIPIPTSLGGDLMPTYRFRGPTPGMCTTVRCGAKATKKCKHPLHNGTPCGRDICDKCGKGDLCPSHQRKLGLRVR